MIEEFLEICDNCGNKFSLDELTEKGLDLICIDCSKPICTECGQQLYDNDNFCCYDCHKQYWKEIMD